MRPKLVYAALVLVLAGCGAAGPFDADAFAIRASSELEVGTERVLIGVRRADGEQLGSPDIAVRIEAAPEDDPAAVQTVPAEFTWIVPEAVGVYRALIRFDRPGTWYLTAVPEGGDPLEPLPVSVLAEVSAPSPGDPAPLAASPTRFDHPLAEITTDSDPDPALYELSLDDAIASGRPTVVVFATPAYCQTAACGPMLQDIKAIAPSHSGVNFIHVEVYTGLGKPDFRPDAAHLAPAVEAWGLRSEPWVFVIDAEGRIAARFEGVLDPSELDPHLPG